MDADYCSLKAETAGFKLSAYSVNTKKSYKSQLYAYIRFCLRFGLVAVPASESTLCDYSSFLARTLKSSSIPCYLNVVRILHVEAGFDNPLEKNWQLSMVKRGIARSKGSPPAQKLPISIPLLKDIHGLLDLSNPADLAFWLACLLAFYGLLRKSTLLPVNAAALVQDKYICRSDVTELSLGSFVLVIRHTKSNQFGQRVLKLPFVACVNSILCPVRQLLSHFGRSLLPQSAPICNFVQGGREVTLTHRLFVDRLKHCIALSGRNSSLFSGHSFRRGGASFCYMMGLSEVQIKIRGDWVSNAYEKYVFVDQCALYNTAKVLSAGAADLAAAL
jgi:hypothetical protein